MRIYRSMGSVLSTEYVNLKVRCCCSTQWGTPRVFRSVDTMRARPTSTARSSLAPCAKGRPDRRCPRSHHQPPGRSTIASQLYNAKEPLTLFELQPWLGHRSPPSPALREDHPEHPCPGLHRGRVLRPQPPHHRGPPRPRRGHLRRRGRRRALAVYDLGHGLLLLHLLRAVPHRMACDATSYSENSSKAQLLEAKDNLQRLLAVHPAHRRGARRRRRRPGRPGTPCSAASPMCPPRQARPPASSEHRQRRPSCRSSKSAKANQNETGHLDST